MRYTQYRSTMLDFIPNDNTTSDGEYYLDLWHNDSYADVFAWEQRVVTLEDLIKMPVIFVDSNVYVFTNTEKLVDNDLLEYICAQYRTYVDSNYGIVLCTCLGNSVGVVPKAPVLDENKVSWFFSMYNKAYYNGTLPRLSVHQYKQAYKMYKEGKQVHELYKALFDESTEAVIAEILYRCAGKHIKFPDNKAIQWFLKYGDHPTIVNVKSHGKNYKALLKCPVYASGKAEVVVTVGNVTGYPCIVSWDDISDVKSDSFDNVTIDYQRYDKMSFGVHEYGWSAFYKETYLASARTKAECMKLARKAYNKQFLNK